MKKIIFLILTILATGFVAGSCSSSYKKEQKEKEKQVEWKEYSNEFFSMKYPGFMEIDEEINNMCDTIPVPVLSKGISVSLYSTLPGTPIHIVHIVKSITSIPYETPEKWRDFSVESGNFDDRYIDTVKSLMQDSLHFGSYPAAMAGFRVVDNGDTLIHKQLVVMVGKDLYYLNNTYSVHDNGSLQQLGDSILSTIRFKSTES